ncbi:MAG: hypothetical protein A3K30_03160 [Deltaproteobacteria bacterium RBG_13_51_10]|nr:MAG: hypothetical protein A3K30_03160 [Deltaproteobacteria bacterium RBG_13_51_10]
MEEKINPTEEEISEAMRVVGVPPLYWEADSRKIIPRLWAQTRDFFESGRGLYIFGTVGTGKTYLCSAIIREHFRRSGTGYLSPLFRIHMISIPDLLLKIKSTFQDKPVSGDSEESLIDRYSGTAEKWGYPIDILFLDDLGIEKPTEWAQQILYQIIDKRYSNLKKTVFTSNLSLDALSERLGDRIPSRIAEMCSIIKLEGKDKRLS